MSTASSTKPITPKPITPKPIAPEPIAPEPIAPAAGPFRWPRWRGEVGCILRVTPAILLLAAAAGLAAPTTIRAASPEATADRSSDEPTVEEIAIGDYDREHWAWSPLRRPALPAVHNAEWCITPIDRFILSKIETAGLEPAVPQERAALLRRLTFDLTGLPPTPAQLRAFITDRHPDAYRRQVDRLLASPDYGPHVALGWLDLARFAETDGFEHDLVREDAWRYRDWVIAAFDADLSYDRFVQQQIAGDQIHDSFGDGVTATAFCLAGPDMPDINSQEERRDYLLNDISSTIGSVFLALQVGCAQCHDHKFDPVSQTDFYRLRACFEPAVAVEQNVSIGTLVRSRRPVAASRLMIRGDWRRPGPTVQPAFPPIANLWDQTIPASQQDQPRAALAAWLTRPDHPLTSRVYANRIWQHHFGSGLSMTPSDFGYLGDEPRHLELLDFLASELVAGGWSRKRLDRMIVMSATYRQSTRRAAEQATAAQATEPREPQAGSAGQVDPENRLWSHYPMRRLSGEQLRDAMLEASGLLSRDHGGPGARPPLPPEMLATLLPNQWDASPHPEQHHRRSIYLFARRNLRFPLFEAFDRPDALTSCAIRYESTTATQALVMQNSDFSLRVAEQLAERCRREAPQNRAAQIAWLVERLYGRAASGEEQQMIAGFLIAGPADETESTVDLALALLCSNEFRYLD